MESTLEGLGIRGVTFGQLGLTIEDDLTLDEYQEAAVALGSLGHSLHWWIGDLLNAAQAAHGDLSAQIEDELGFAHETLMNWKSVAGKVPGDVRRPLPITWTHHRLVAPFDPLEQEDWLDMAVEKGWDSQQLREAIDAKYPERANGGANGRPSVLDSASAVARVAQRDGDRFLVPVEPMLALIRAVS